VVLVSTHIYVHTGNMRQWWAQPQQVRRFPSLAPQRSQIEKVKKRGGGGLKKGD
jgi:hypothetical protein